MSDARYQVWLRKIGNKKSTSAPKLKSLPPTSEAFAENVKRAHFQTAVWKSALEGSPPDVNATDFGWNRDEKNKCLIPVPLPPNVQPAPSEFLKVIRCRFSSDSSCLSAMCICMRGHLACTIFCGCQTSNCQNSYNKYADAEQLPADEDDVEEGITDS